MISSYTLTLSISFYSSIQVILSQNIIALYTFGEYFLSSCGPSSTLKSFFSPPFWFFSLCIVSLANPIWKTKQNKPNLPNPFLHLSLLKIAYQFSSSLALFDEQQINSANMAKSWALLFHIRHFQLNLPSFWAQLELPLSFVIRTSLSSTPSCSSDTDKNLHFYFHNISVSNSFSCADIPNP